MTGAATLGVAVLLVSQLRQQHRDAERELLYTSQGSAMQAALQRPLGPRTSGRSGHKGGSQDYDSLECGTAAAVQKALGKSTVDAPKSVNAQIWP
ncbi:MAG: hypothetical protein ACJZ4L_04855 [Candidatus Poriferisodalaceae bacterium]